MNPITVIPWDRDFLTGLSRHLAERFKGRFENLLLLFPHRRPRRYLKNKLAQEPKLPKPCLLPRMLSIDELFAELAGRMHPAALKPLSLLDRVALLRQVTQRLGVGLRSEDQRLPGELKDFFPWGLKLAQVMEELFEHGVSAKDLDHVGDLVAAPASALLGSLGAIQKAYAKTLLESGFSTPGLLRSIVATDPARAAGLMEGRLSLACGFHGLTGCEEALLKTLWRKGQAEILWHTDPAVATPGTEAHWSCREHTDWLASWKAKARLVQDPDRSPLPSWRDKGDQFSLFSAVSAPEPATRAAVTFHQGFDLHSQLAGLRRELDALEDSGQGGYAVVLPDTSMLMPVLHHLPRRDVNVSMGYPLERSPLAQLVETVLTLQDGRMSGGYHWREVIALLRHPLLKLLRLGEETPLRALFHEWERAIRAGEKYLDPRHWREALPGVLPDARADALPDGRPDARPGGCQDGRPDALPDGQANACPDNRSTQQHDGGAPPPVTDAAGLVDRIVATCFTAFEDISTPRDMALALAGLARLLLDPAHSGNRWESFVIDASCLGGLLDRVIPELHDSLLSHETFPPETVRAMTRQTIKRQRVPFEADPLSGLQVLGMLETRLLSFERVFILGANEEALPGAPAPDALLPDPLRQALGLPGQRERDIASAHTFHRLLQGARQVSLYYSSGVQPGLLDGKSQPSRYVEQLIWEEEKRQKRILKPGEEPIRLLSMPMRGLKHEDASAPNTPASRMKLQTLLRYRGVSPTMLDAFLRCPLAFHMKYLTPLEPLEEVAEEGDPPALGEMVHRLLQDALTPFKGLRLEPGSLDGEALATAFLERLAAERFFAQLPGHLRILLAETGQRRLRAFAASHPAFTPLELEHPFQASLELGGERLSLKGVIDRLDQRDEGLCIVDYKTGAAKKPASAFWEDEAVWSAVEAGDVEAGLAALPRLAKGLNSIQMPLYLHAYAQATGRVLDNGLFICLGHDGKEEPLFSRKDSPESRAVRINEQTPALAAFIIRMMLETPVFTPQPGRICAWCPWRQVCAAAQTD